MTAEVFNPDHNKAKSIFEFSARSINMEPVKLDIYTGFVCIIVNIATRSPMADHGFKTLNEMYEMFYERGMLF